MNSNRNVWRSVFAGFAGLGLLVWCVLLAAQEQSAPKFTFDPDWPKTLPNKWKM